METVRKITLAGKEWEIPPLVIRQTRIIDPLIIKLAPVLAKWRAPTVASLPEIDQEQYDGLLLIAYTALHVRNKELTIDQFYDMPVTLYELLVAFPQIAYQTGLFTEQPQKELAPGEAPAP